MTHHTPSSSTSAGRSPTGAGPTLAETGEFDLIGQVAEGLASGPDVLVGPGDDAAVVDLGSPVVCTTDTMVESVHFRRDWCSAEQVGRKVLAVNVADVEAMGAVAQVVVVAFSAPAELPAQWATDCMRGLAEEASRCGVRVVGGDITRARDVTLTVTALGATSGPVVRRSGAEPGQVVALRGRVGWAAAGLAVLGRGFRSPRAVVEAYQVPEVPYGAGQEAARAGAGAMIDVSDGLVADLGHVARASGVVVDLRREAFTVPEPLQAVAAATGKDPLGFLLGGGEDHALAATFAEDAVPQGWTVVGRVSSPGDGGPGVLVDGTAWEGDAGHDHFRR